MSPLTLLISNKFNNKKKIQLILIKCINNLIKIKFYIYFVNIYLLL